MQRWGKSPLALEDGCTSTVLPVPLALALKTDRIGVNSDSTTYRVYNLETHVYFLGSLFIYHMNGLFYFQIIVP